MEFEVFFDDSERRSRPGFSIRFGGETYEFYSPILDKYHLKHRDRVVPMLERLATDRLQGLAKHGAFPESNRDRILASIRKGRLQDPLRAYSEFLEKLELELEQFRQKFESATIEVRLESIMKPYVSYGSFDEAFAEIVSAEVRIGSKSSKVKVKDASSYVRGMAATFTDHEVSEHVKTTNVFTEVKNQVVTSLAAKMKAAVDEAVENGKNEAIGHQIRALFKEDAKRRVKNLIRQATTLSRALDLTFDDMIEIVEETFVEEVHES